jgi:hypothetical protein
MADFLSSVWDSARSACCRGYDKPGGRGCQWIAPRFFLVKDKKKPAAFAAGQPANAV